MTPWGDSLPATRWTVIREWPGRPGVTWAMGCAGRTLARGEVASVKAARQRIEGIKKHGPEDHHA